MSRVFQRQTACVLISIVRTVSFSFFEKKNHKDVQAIERLIQCQFSFWVIPIHHSDLGDACPVAASALIHCPPVSVQTFVCDECRNPTGLLRQFNLVVPPS